MAATDYTDVAQQLYISYFGRPADTYGLASYTAELAAAGAPTTLAELNTAVQADPNGGLAKLIQSFNSSAESIALYGTGNDTLSISKFINAVYNNVLHRDADNEGGQFWINAIVTGQLSKANAALAITQAALENTSAQGLIDAKVVANTLAVAEDFTTSLDTLPKVNAYAGDDAAALGRGLLTGVTATTTVSGYHSNVTDLITTLTAPPVVNVTLTDGVDTLVGGAGNDVFNATGDTFTALDKIDGGAGNNTLVISDAAASLGAAVVAGVVVKNIQNVSINTAGGLGVAAGAAYDVTGFGGLTNLTASTTGAVNVKVADTTAATITNAGAAGAAAGVTVTGGSSATVTTGAGAVVIAGNAGGLTSATVVGGTTVDISTAAVTGAVDKLTSVSLKGNTGVANIQSDALTSLSLNATSAAVNVNAAAGTRALGVTLNGVTGGTITDGAATTVNVTSTGTASTGATLAVASATSVTLGGDKALTLAALNADLATSLTVSDSALTTISAFGTTNKLATVTVTGAGGLSANLSAQSVLTTVDASASSGANSVTLGTSTIYKGGSGVDTVTLTAAPTVAVDGGAGTNDVLILNAADFLHAKATGFETLGLGALATGNYDATGFSHLSIANTVTGPVGFTNVAAGADLSLTGSVGQTVAYSLANTTGITDVLSLKLAAGATAANNVTAAGIETVNIALTDTNTTAGHAAFVETLTLSASAATKIAVTGNGSFGLTLVDTDTALTSVDASGLTVAGTGAGGSGFSWTTANLAAAATIKGSVNGGDTIDGTAATKALTITVNGGTNAVTGGSAADTITAGNGSNTIIAGAGNDIITVGSGANSITGGTGADIITLAAHAGKVDTIIQAALDSGANNAAINQTSVLTTTLDVVKGIAAGDKLSLATIDATFATGDLVFNATNLAAADDKISFASGTYDATNGVFNYGVNGADTLVTYDTTVGAGVTGESIVLVGYHASATATTAATGVITLG
jgi:S-layer protein